MAFWVVWSIVDHLNLDPLPELILEAEKLKKKMLVTFLKQIALNGSRREVLPELSRMWYGQGK